MCDYERLLNYRREDESRFRVAAILGWQYAGNVQEGLYGFPKGFPVKIFGMPAEQVLVDDCGEVIRRQW